MPKKNKAKFNICNAHYALQTIGDEYKADSSMTTQKDFNAF